jgi:hypothetical protein
MANLLVKFRKTEKKYEKELWATKSHKKVLFGINNLHNLRRMLLAIGK